ncbi:CBS domain-containing protein [Gloeothece citriformis]|uniref:CBS domain-containing protein n=1 Tax=Gloeothece citriformis TaxID=2546356 RepID=UPI00059BA7F8|nr:CBS domain-containing protein [Gloeothece citriformis]
MDLILCHQTADFDAIGAAVGLSRLKIGSKIVLTGGAHPAVRDFLALHRDELPLVELRSVNPEQIRSIIVVDSQHRDRLGKASAWFDLPHITSIELYDHHPNGETDIPATQKYIEPIGATTTLIVEKLQQEKIQLTPIEATVMALGIHVDTGSLTFEQTTDRDAYSLAWLMTQGANVKIIAEYAEPGFTPQLQQLFSDALETIQTSEIRGYTVAWVLLTTDSFIPGLSNLAERLIELTESDALLFGHSYTKGQSDNNSAEKRLTVIGRSRIGGVDLNQLFTPYEGGGHPQAASVSFRGIDPQQMLTQLVEQLIELIPQPLSARDLMSSPVRTIRPETTIEQAQRILLRYGHSGLSVVDEKDQLVGIISRRDIDLALHHGFSHAPVKGYMTRNPKTITPETSLPEIEELMVTYDLGRLPVVKNEQLLGIVTRTDVLRQIHQDRLEKKERHHQKIPLISCLLPSFQERLYSPIWNLLQNAAKEAQQRGWHLYLVGGAVRDLLLAPGNQTLLLQDIDLVVDGFHRAADVGAGVELASKLREIYPQVRLSVHGEFQTAALIWHKDPELGSLMIDIATARTEFYPYPAANPQVEASSIRQDLYRRDFTINALAVRLTSPKEGELLDFFGGVEDLRSHQIKVLHANSFIEDPTRIYRAVRFAVRLGFKIEPLTEEYIRYAIESGVYEKLRLENHPAPALTTRLRAELNYILEASYWKPALQLLSHLGALRPLHSQLVLTGELWWEIRCVSRWLRYLDPDHHVSHWLIRLEILIASLKTEERIKIASNLQLPKDSIERLENLDSMEKTIKSALPNCQKVSEFVLLLRQYKIQILIIVGVRSDKSIRHIIWQYLTQWSKTQALLNGNDLKAMGYKPSPKFKEILDQLLIATLDQKIETKQEAVDFVKTIDN